MASPETHAEMVPTQPETVPHASVKRWPYLTLLLLTLLVARLYSLQRDPAFMSWLQEIREGYLRAQRLESARLSSGCPRKTGLDSGG